MNDQPNGNAAPDTLRLASVTVAAVDQIGAATAEEILATAASIAFCARSWESITVNPLFGTAVTAGDEASPVQKETRVAGPVVVTLSVV